MRALGIALALWLGVGGIGSAQTLDLTGLTDGWGWVLLELDDLNAALQEAGYPELPQTPVLYGLSALFPFEESSSWQWGLSALGWSSRAERGRVALDALFVGGLLDWTVRSLAGGRISLGGGAGLDSAQLTVRKGLALAFDEVLRPLQGQLSQVRRWGLWAMTYLQYELVVFQDDFLIRSWGGWLWAPWHTGWSQRGELFGPLPFSGPPAQLGGPFLLVQASLGF